MYGILDTRTFCHHFIFNKQKNIDHYYTTFTSSDLQYIKALLTQNSYSLRVHYLHIYSTHKKKKYNCIHFSREFSQNIRVQFIRTKKHDTGRCKPVHISALFCKLKEFCCHGGYHGGLATHECGIVGLRYSVTVQGCHGCRNRLGLLPASI